IGSTAGTDNDLRLKYPLLYNVWLMFERPPWKDYIHDRYPLLESMDFMTLSPEGSRFPLGGLGRVQDSHVEGLADLAQDGMTILEGEPYYRGTYDPLTQPGEGYQPPAKYDVFTHPRFGQEFSI